MQITLLAIQHTRIRISCNQCNGVTQRCSLL